MTEATSAVSVALTRQMLWRFASVPAPFELLYIDKPMSIERGGHAYVREGVSGLSLLRCCCHFLEKYLRTCQASNSWWQGQGYKASQSHRHPDHPHPKLPPDIEGHPMRDQFSSTQAIRKPAVSSKGGIVAAQSSRAAQVGAEVLAAAATASTR